MNSEEREEVRDDDVDDAGVDIVEDEVIELDRVEDNVKDDEVGIVEEDEVDDINEVVGNVEEELLTRPVSVTLLKIARPMIRLGGVRRVRTPFSLFFLEVNDSGRIHNFWQLSACGKLVSSGK